jgi:hypothetical protein
VRDNLSQQDQAVHWYVVEQADRLGEDQFVPVTNPTTNHVASLDGQPGHSFCARAPLPQGMS